ncbi:MAG: peptide-methionine (R)-S-oxide reductase MsrB [Bacillota bacterium]
MQKELYLAGGCFWGIERYIGALSGVLQTEVGYANGDTHNPTYREVCEKDTGHAETVRVVYDADEIALEELLNWFFEAIDPEAVDRQGPDRGRQYRSGIYYIDPADEPVIRAKIASVAAKGNIRVATEVLPLRCFYPAEEYHQKYLQKNPGGYCHLAPGLLQKAKGRPVRVKQEYPRPPEEELKKTLGPLSYAVARQNATEPPYSHPEWNRFEPGLYVDIATGEPLFSSRDKFFSACGWPSFAKPVDADVVREKKDLSHGMVRTEVRSRAGDSHLGHVFEDGETSLGGLRYCINGAALRFIPKSEMEREGYGRYLPLVD